MKVEDLEARTRTVAPGEHIRVCYTFYMVKNGVYSVYILFPLSTLLL